MAKKVKTKWVVTVPKGNKILVNLGQEVMADQELVETIQEQVKTINISERIKGLSGTEKEKMAEEIKGLYVSEGEAVFKTSGIFGKKVFLPINGEIIKIDEFENLHYKEKTDKPKKITSPVTAKVTKKEDELLELEFKAIEYEGKGINEGRVWATKGISYVHDIVSLSSVYKDQILMTEDLDQIWLMKAEVIGAKGVIVIDKQEAEESDRINSKLPILAIESDEWQELKKNVEGVERAMMNAAKGRLILVI